MFTVTFCLVTEKYEMGSEKKVRDLLSEFLCLLSCLNAKDSTKQLSKEISSILSGMCL